MCSARYDGTVHLQHFYKDPVLEKGIVAQSIHKSISPCKIYKEIFQAYY